MKRILLFSIALSLITLASWGLTPAVHADSGYAALLVLFGPDDFITECIPLPGDMTAFDLVTASSMGVIMETDEDGDSAMCSIDGTGCAYPDEDCFCQCGSGTCLLWTDWYWDDSQWEVSLSSDERIISNGDIEAWAWGDGLSEPPIVSFADICPGVVVVDDPTPTSEPTTADYPEAPTQQASTDDPYPGSVTANADPTATASAAGNTTATATRTAAVGRSSPTSRQQTRATATLRIITPTRMAAGTPTRFAGIDQSASADDATPTPAAAAAEPSGSTTPDQVAMLINTSVARVRATALTTQSSIMGVLAGWLRWA